MEQQKFIQGKHVYIDQGPGRARRWHRDGEMSKANSSEKPKEEEAPVRPAK